MTIFAVHAYQPSPNNNPSVNTALWGSERGVLFHLCRRRFCSSSKSKPSTIHIFISTMAVASDWVVTLTEKYGSQVEDLLQGTGLQHWGETLGFGIHVVRNAISPSQAAEFMGELDRSVANAAATSIRGNHGVAVQCTGGTRCYKTIQGTTGHCTCKSRFAGNAKHELYRVADVPALKSFEDWVNGHDVSHNYRVNEVLGNIYSREDDEHINWHDDTDELYQTSTDVLSLSVGSPGVFCFQPRKNDSDDRLYQVTGAKRLKIKARRQQAIDKGLRGLVPLFSGDLLVMSGNCQYYMQHKTLKFSRLTDTAKLLAAYTATSETSKELLPSVSIKPEEISLANRGNFTGRIISHHETTPVRCPGIPATLQLPHVPPTLNMCVML